MGPTNKKKILFLTGTRADFGKLKPVASELKNDSHFDIHFFATGMHMLQRFGYTYNEIVKAGFGDNLFPYFNQAETNTMEEVLADTIHGLSRYVKSLNPDLLVVHGDRVEALAGAIVGSLLNIRIAHLEGGEVSGTVDESIRHSVSKLSHHHFVANDRASKLLLRLGESKDRIHVVGSPDLDIMASQLPPLKEVMSHYNIPFKEYAIAALHPVTTATLVERYEQAMVFVSCLLESGLNYVVIYPNNDLGYDQIMQAYARLEDNPRFLIFPSLRFEYFLSLLKSAQLIIGNSSAGVRESPFWGVPSVNVGNRQYSRANSPSIKHCAFNRECIIHGIQTSLKKKRFKATQEFGAGDTSKKVIKILKQHHFWEMPLQKHFGIQ